MKPENQELQKETKVGEGYKLTDVKDEMPRIISHVVQRGGEGTISPTSEKPTRERYDVELGGEQNLHTQYVKPNFIEHQSAFK